MSALLDAAAIAERFAAAGDYYDQETQDAFRLLAKHARESVERASDIERFPLAWRDTLVAIVTGRARDWKANERDAKIYGIVVGWSDADLSELAIRFQWDEDAITWMGIWRDGFWRVVWRRLPRRGAAGRARPGVPGLSSNHSGGDREADGVGSMTTEELDALDAKALEAHMWEDIVPPAPWMRADLYQAGDAQWVVVDPSGRLIVATEGPGFIRIADYVSAARVEWAASAAAVLALTAEVRRLRARHASSPAGTVRLLCPYGIDRDVESNELCALPGQSIAGSQIRVVQARGLIVETRWGVVRVEPLEQAIARERGARIEAERLASAIGLREARWTEVTGCQDPADMIAQQRALTEALGAARHESLVEAGRRVVAERDEARADLEAMLAADHAVHDVLTQAGVPYGTPSEADGIDWSTAARVKRALDGRAAERETDETEEQ